MPAVSLPGVHLFHEVVGAGPPLLAINGSGTDLRMPMSSLQWARLPSITAPTLVAAGRHDGIAPLANSEALAARIAHGDLAVFEGGHAFFVQDPTSWPAMVDFLVGVKDLRDLVEGYAAAADARDGAAFGALFLAEAWLETRPAGGRYDGAEAIASIPGKLAGYSSTDHRVGDSAFTVDGSVASGTTGCEAHHVRGEIDKVMTITYHDTFGRDAGGRWRFASRVVDIERIEELPT